MASGVLTHRVHARAGLLGNPSDGYGGAAIAILLENFYAEVTLHPAEQGVSCAPHPVHDRSHFTSLADMHGQLARVGYRGGVHLLQATCKRFFDYCTQHCVGVGLTRGFNLTYSTTIPRQLGLSGSSALIYAGLKCLLEYYQVDMHGSAAMEVRPGLVLSVERDELGIAAGWMDRVIQVHGEGVCFMDFGVKDSFSCTPLDPGLLPPLHLMWADAPSESGKVHANVRQRWLERDPAVVQGMQDCAQCALEGRAALEAGDVPRLMALMNRNFDLRRGMFGDACLGPTNLRMVEIARAAGAAAKLAGSGGCVLVCYPSSNAQVAEALAAACGKEGFSLQAVRVARRQ